jgi:hypothetical protein
MVPDFSSITNGSAIRGGSLLVASFVEEGALHQKILFQNRVLWTGEQYYSVFQHSTESNEKPAGFRTRTSGLLSRNLETEGEKWTGMLLTYDLHARIWTAGNDYTQDCNCKLSVNTHRIQYHMCLFHQRICNQYTWFHSQCQVHHRCVFVWVCNRVVHKKRGERHDTKGD